MMPCTSEEKVTVGEWKQESGHQKCSWPISRNAEDIHILFTTSITLPISSLTAISLTAVQWVYLKGICWSDHQKHWTYIQRNML